MKRQLEEVKQLQKIAGILKENAISEYEKVDIGGGKYKDDEGNISGEKTPKTYLKPGQMSVGDINFALRTLFQRGMSDVVSAAKFANDRRHYDNMLNKKLAQKGKSLSTLGDEKAKQAIDDLWRVYGKKTQPTPASLPPQAPTTEALSIDAMDRMDGLVSQRAISQLIGGAQQVIKDLKADGFDDEDIFDYIMERIKVLA